jgi:hypothetical protein
MITPYRLQSLNLQLTLVFDRLCNSANGIIVEAQSHAARRIKLCCCALACCWVVGGRCWELQILVLRPRGYPP